MQKEEDAMLRVAGFEAGEDDLRKRGTLWFGRQAVLQRMRSNPS